MNNLDQLLSLSLLFLALALIPTASESQSVLLSWEFTGKTGNEALGIAATTADNVSASAPSGTLVRGDGLRPNSHPHAFSAIRWSSDMAFDAGSTDYLEFSIEPATGYFLDLSSIDMRWASAGAGPQKISLTSSLDDHATPIGTYSVSNAGSNPHGFSLAGLPSTNQLVTFRLSGYDAKQLVGAGRLGGPGNDLEIRGTVGSCGILSAGPLEIGCAIGSEDEYNPDSEGVKLAIPYQIATGVSLTVTAEDDKGNPLYYQVNSLDAENGTITTEGPLEGDGYVITISDGICEYTFTGIVSPTQCAPDCGVTFGTPSSLCAAFTPDPDAVTLTIPYTGAAAGTALSVDPPLANTGDDPATKADGFIALTGAVEGQTYVVILSEGTACSSSIVVTVPRDQCETVDDRIFINEILYDNIHDFGNFVEIAVPMTGRYSSVPLSELKVLLYDGATGTVYSERTLTPLDAGTPSQNYQYYVWETDPQAPESGMQNGAPDGIAIVVEGRVAEFLSYEGTFTASTGYAGGLSCTDVGLVLYGGPSGDPINVSLQRSGDCSPPNVSCPDRLVWTKAAATMGADNLSSFLPITLQSFTAFAERETVVLEWVTAAEIDNDYFAIERSADGRTFATIARVAGAGSSDQKNSYTHADDQPLGGRSYYRLRQVDYDGTTEYYGPVAVTFAFGAEAPVRVWPNPANDRLTLEGELKPRTRATLLDAAGRPLRNWTLTDQAPRQELSLHGLAAGVYWLRLADDNAVRTLRFIRN